MLLEVIRPPQEVAALQRLSPRRHPDLKRRLTDRVPGGKAKVTRQSGHSGEAECLGRVVRQSGKAPEKFHSSSRKYRIAYGTTLLCHECPGSAVNAH